MVTVVVLLLLLLLLLWSSSSSSSHLSKTYGAGERERGPELVHALCGFSASGLQAFGMWLMRLESVTLRKDGGLETSVKNRGAVY